MHDSGANVSLSLRGPKTTPLWQRLLNYSKPTVVSLFTVIFPVVLSQFEPFSTCSMAVVRWAHTVRVGSLSAIEHRHTLPPPCPKRHCEVRHVLVPDLRYSISMFFFPYIIVFWQINTYLNIYIVYYLATHTLHGVHSSNTARTNHVLSNKFKTSNFVYTI